MKKLLALVLTLCTLLCLYPMAVSAEEAPELDAEAGSYLDLYVKDGLVALFTAYDGVASEEEATVWTPVDFYGKTGYDSYADPATYTTSLVKGSNLGWKWENGYLSHYWHTDPGQRCNDTTSLFDLSSVGALLGTDDTYTVQAIYQMVIPQNTAKTSYPIIEGNTVTNLSSLGNGGGSGTFLMLKANPTVIGDFAVANLWYYTYLDNWNSPRLGIYYEQIGSTYYLYTSEYYTGTTPNANLVGDNGVALGSYYYLDGTETGTFERTFLRKSATEFTLHDYAPIPRTNGGGYGSNDINVAVTDTDATTLKLFGGAGHRAYSVRVYNDVLTAEDMERNHLADLCGYYGVDASDILAMSDADITSLAATAASIKIARVADEFEGGKDALEAAVNEIANREALEAEKAARLDLYVKDGLVALFSAYGASASSAAATSWTPVDFSDNAEYPDYADVAAYTLAAKADSPNLGWKWENGYLSLHSVKEVPMLWGQHRGDASDAYLDLSALGAALMGADAAGTLSLQEVYQLAGPANTLSNGTMAYPQITDGVLTNSETHLNFFTQGGGTVVGGFSNNLSYYTKLESIKSFYGGYFYQMPAANTGLDGAHQYLLTDYYGYTKDHTITKADGSSLAGFYMPVEKIGVLESTVMRYDATTYKFHLQNGVYHWTSNGITTDFNFTATANTDSTAIKAVMGHPANIYSVRVYNKALNSAELAQNHFADLVNFYEVNVPTDLFELLTTEEIAAMYEAAADVSIARTLDDVDFIEGTYELMMVIIDAMSVITEEAESIVSFGGVAYRTSGDYGVRALFSVDKEAIASLESRGYTVVAYGAIVGVGVNGETTVNESADALTVELDENGKVTLASGTGKVVSTDAEGSFKHLTDDNVSFALSTTFAADGSQSAYYSTTLIYRAFTVITLEGEEEYAVLYDDVTLGETEEAISLISVHEYALTDTTGMTPELIERLEAVLPADEE